MARPRSRAARRKVLDAAAETLFDVGVPSFTIDEVARRSGVAKTTIYRHFGDRNGLLVEAIDAAIESPTVPDHGTLRDDLLDFLAQVRPIFADDKLRAVTFEVSAAGIRDPELRARFGSMMAGRMRATYTIFSNAQRRGEIAPDLSHVEALEIMEGPFIVRSFGMPELIDDIELARLVERMLVLLKVPARPSSRDADASA